MATNIGNHLKVWLNFQHSPTEDLKGNTWTTYGNPTIGAANAFNGNALQLDGQSYIKLSGIELGGQDFYIDGWVYVDPASPEKARIISVVNPTNGYHMFSVRKSPNDSSKLDIWVNETADVSVNSGFTSTERDTASVGQRVHFKIIYRYADFHFILCINDRTQAYVVNSGYCPQYTRQKFDIYIGALPNGNQGLIGSIDELRIYDGTWFSYNYGNVPTTSDYNSVYFKADIKTDIHNSLTEWRYENAGYADLLITSGTTVTGLTPTQSKTGTAFYQTSRAKCFDIPATKEIWIKCDVYCNLNDRWRIYNGGTAGSTGICSQTNKDLNFWANSNNVKTYSNSIIKNQLQTVLLHMVSDSAAGIVEAWLDGTKLSTYTGNVNNGDAFADIYLQSDGAGTFFSNVIISNFPVDIDEDVDLHTYLNVDLVRSTSNAVTAAFDTSRSLVSTQTVNADTSRHTTVAASLNADTLRNVGKALTDDFDTARGVANALTVNLDTARELASGFKAWLRFDESTTKDEYWNSWTAYNSPTISADNAAFGKALQLTTAGLGANGQFVALDDGCTIGGQDFTVDGWAFMPTDIPRVARIFSFCNVFGDNSQKTFYLGQKATTGQLELNYNNNWSALSANLKGQRFHFAVVYEHSKNLLTLYIDGQAVGTLNQTFTRTFYQYVFVGRANYDTHSTWLGAIDEFRINDGLARWTENFTPPTLNDYTNFPLALDLKPDTCRNVLKSLAARADSLRNVSNALTANIDTARNISGAITVSADVLRNITAPNVWRYENYGIADLLSGEGTFFTVENLDKSQAIYKSAFYQTERAKCFDIPATKEIWIKCDIWTPNRYSVSDKIYIGSDDGNGLNGWSQPIGNEVYKLVHNGSEKYLRYKLGENTRYRFLLHMKSGSSDGLLEVYIGGSDLDGSFSGNVNNGDDFKNVYISTGDSIYATGNNEILISNLIISNAPVDINENVYPTINLSCDTLRFFPATCLVSLDTARNVLWQAPLNIDTYRFVTCSVDIIADIFSLVNYAVQFDCDVIRTLPHSFILSPVENLGSVPDTSNDAQALTQSIEIRLNEQSLTDEVVIVTVKPVDIMEQVQGQYLDYPFNMRIETCKQRGILNTCTCCSDIDEILYKQLEYTIPEDECWHNVDTESSLSPSAQEIDEEYALASTHIQTIANIIGKTPILRFADFISTVDITAGGTTYNDLIRSIFGWTARIPQMMINCYLRDDKLFVVQRGHEANVIDFSHLKIDFAGIDREVKRTIWGSKPWAKTEVNEIRGLPWKNLITAPWSEKSSDNTVYTYYTDGLVWTATTTNGNSETVTTYYYNSFDNNGRRCLTEEITEVFENKKLIDRNITYHNQLGQGQKHILSTDADGEYLGSVMGNSNGDDRVTPYSAYTYINGQKQAVIAIQHGYDKIKQERTLYGISSFDTSFPVHGDDKLIEITKAIKWLNRRTQETVTLNLFDYPHVLDFNDRLVFNGNYYFLKSNTALKTPRIVNKQTVAMVRWY